MVVAAVNQRDLSEKLEELAKDLEDNITCGCSSDVAYNIAKELRKLSNENYAPGNSQTWADIKPKGSKKSFTQGNRKMPF